MTNKFETLITNSLQLVVQSLKNADVVALPTETVYGLAADATKDLAVQSIYRVKGRPSSNPLIVHVSTIESALKWGSFSVKGLKIAEEVWLDSSFSGAVTLVVPLKENTENELSPYVLAGQKSIALRLPRHPLFKEVLSSIDFPLAAPSANRSNYVSPTCAEHVKWDLDGLIPYILDGGKSQYGLESTIIDIQTDIPSILRLGSSSYEYLQSRFSDLILSKYENSKAVPGLSRKHYSPKAKIHLNILPENKRNFYVGFGSMPCDLNLSLDGSLEEAACNLYHVLRQIDRDKINIVDFAPIPHDGLGRAINDRLKRAAST
ncbi:MAG: threonylcarbamoyl-AMP synthase [Candidatus Puniceispirillum sp.]|nr:threonylcarbamoyl-AMP synthase [Candidatus Pelagibacter sp.]MBA4283686.1 threonylcarbamoyl-AMP synthase [Candidatus Puniceispirillum sp.]